VQVLENLLNPYYFTKYVASEYFTMRVALYWTKLWNGKFKKI